MFFLLIALFIFMLLLLAFIAGSITILFSDFFLELPYVGVSKKRQETIIKFANIKKGEKVVDLGSGDGRLLILCAQKGAFAIGYELNPLLVVLTKLKAFLSHTRCVPGSIKAHTGCVVVKRQNFWQADLKTTDVIFVYSLKKYMPQFEDFIYKNTRKGTRVIVNTNPFPNKKPIKSENGIFLYKI